MGVPKEESLAQVYEGRFMDRTPHVRSAGKLFPVGERAASCLHENYPRPATPPVVQKFLNTRRSNPGVRTIFYGKANDPDVENYIVHGVSTRPSLSAGALINTPPKTLFQQRLIEKRESLYSSHRQTPLGKSHDQAVAFPSTVNVNKMVFGRKYERGLSAGVLVNPSKSMQEIEEESRKGHDIYVVTHNDYDVGEVRDRKYDWSKYRKDRRFGIDTPHFNDGRNVARTLKWIQAIKTNEGANIISKRVDDFRERTQYQLGKVRDPIADTMNVPVDHTFGVLLHSEKYGVGDVLHNRAPGDFLRGKDKHRATLAAVQQHLKKANHHHFGSLLEAFKHYDKNGDGKIDKKELKNACVRFGLDLDSNVLDSLYEHCDADKDGFISFVEFSNFLTWKDKMSIGKPEEKIITQGLMKPEELVWKEEGGSEKTTKTISMGDEQPDVYQTSSSRIGEAVAASNFAKYHAFGIPTVRTDIAPPRIRRISDRNNYGDESNAYGLLCPSIFSQYMVYERDLFKSRPKEEVIYKVKGGYK
ncbi:EF-hand domain-containing family member B [Hyperolius riggenbachi]|uniref:EF-hand domain-containing family member B n=1 Tax=Hyperolius riggenbachi TaxID=752182 RepID=UPI0035A3475E